MEQPKRTTDLAKNKKTISRQEETCNIELVKVQKFTDLLSCKTIASQIMEHNEQSVLMSIRLSVEKCAIGLNIQLSDLQVLTLCEDIMNTYTSESLEDVRECLKKGRRGAFGFGMNSRNSLTMVLVREWMSKHLEQKAIEREKLHQKNKEEMKNILQDVDYEAYKIRQKEDKAKSKKERDKNFESWKAQYLAKRKQK